VKRLLVLIVVLLLSGVSLHANLARLASLGLVAGDSDWMISDAENVLSNPALLPHYTGRLGLFELNAVDSSAENVYGTALFRLAEWFHVGFTIGYPVQGAADLNLYRTGDPSNAAKIVTQSASSGGLINNTILTPTILSPFASAATVPVGLDEPVSRQDIIIHGALNFDPIRLGLSLGYVGASTEYSDRFSNVTIVSNNSHTASSAIVRQYEIKGGAEIFNLFEGFSLAGEMGLMIPVIERISQTWHPWDSAYFSKQEISSYGAWGFLIGTTVRWEMSKETKLNLRFLYRHQDYSIKTEDRLDNNGDNEYMIDPSDRNITDWHIRRYNTWQAGFSASHTLKFGNDISLNAFVGTYLKVVYHDIRSLGTRGDNNTATTGDNYVDPYQLEVTESLVPIIIGGEAKLNSWLKARFSAVRNIVDHWSEETTLRNFTAGVNSVITYSEYTREFKRAPLTQLNIGATLELSGFTMDWLIKKSWFGKGGALIGEEEAISTQFSITFLM